MYGEGISKTGELLDLGVMRSGREIRSMVQHGDERIGQGRENAKIFLLENEDIAYELEDKIGLHMDWILKFLTLKMMMKF